MQIRGGQPAEQRAASENTTRKPRMNTGSTRSLFAIAYAALCPTLFLLGPIGASLASASESCFLELAKSAEPGPRVSTDRTGVIPTEDGKTLRLTTDLGSVKIVSLEPGSPMALRYTVHIETDARASAAERLLSHYSITAKATPTGVDINGALPAQMGHAGLGAQFWVQFEVAVPRGYNVDVKTEAGDIETQDIGGTAVLSTQGGVIRAGRVGVNLLHDAGPGRLVAKLDTGGGHIQVADVTGDLHAFTAGGHINAGNVAGDAFLHSGGGHIRAGQIAGRADLETDGGNITVGRASGLVSVRTGGGQIDFGEVRGSVRAQTGGGGIRIMYVSGPMEVESSAGSICLTRVAGTVRAATAGGTIRAWINPDTPSSGGTVHLAGASQLTSGNGDIVVFLPRNLAANIDATVESGGEHRIEADPNLGLTIQAAHHGTGPVHAVGVLNGGGPPLKLRTTSGTIKLQFLDSEVALRESLIREQRERLTERGVVVPATFDNPASAEPQAELQSPEDKGDWLDSWIDHLQLMFLGGVREDADEFRKHLVAAPAPAYPDIARRAGVQGVVRLQVRASKDGRVEVVKLIEGAPSLADAAIGAVKQWRVNPVWMNGKKGDVISTVTFNFQLH